MRFTIHPAYSGDEVETFLEQLPMMFDGKASLEYGVVAVHRVGDEHVAWGVGDGKLRTGRHDGRLGRHAASPKNGGPCH